MKRLKELELENSRLRKAVSDLTLDKLILTGGRQGKLLSPARRRACIEHIREHLHVSERRACAALGQHRSTQRKVPRGREDDERLTVRYHRARPSVRSLRLSQDRRAAAPYRAPASWPATEPTQDLGPSFAKIGIKFPRRVHTVP